MPTSVSILVRNHGLQLLYRQIGGQPLTHVNERPNDSRRERRYAISRDTPKVLSRDPDRRRCSSDRSVCLHLRRLDKRQRRSETPDRPESVKDCVPEADRQ